jgi:hypothetical protein
MFSFNLWLGYIHVSIPFQDAFHGLAFGSGHQAPEETPRRTEEGQRAPVQLPVNRKWLHQPTE